METPENWDAVGGVLEILMSDMMPRIRVPEILSCNQGDLKSLITSYIGMEGLQRERVDGICFELLGEKGLVTVDDPESLFWVFERMRCACDFLGQLFPPNSQDSPVEDIPPDWTSVEIYSWLLVDLWNRRADHWLKLVCLEVSTGLPFYGIDPADPDLGE